MPCGGPCANNRGQKSAQPSNNDDQRARDIIIESRPPRNALPAPHPPSSPLLSHTSSCLFLVAPVGLPPDWIAACSQARRVYCAGLNSKPSREKGVTETPVGSAAITFINRSVFPHWRQTEASRTKSNFYFACQEMATLLATKSIPCGCGRAPGRALFTRAARKTLHPRVGTSFAALAKASAADKHRRRNTEIWLSPLGPGPLLAPFPKA